MTWTGRRSHTVGTVRHLCAFCAVVFALPTAARADLVAFSDATDLIDTSWSDSVSIPQFDATSHCPNGACALAAVDITLTGYLASNVRLESLDRTAATVFAETAAQVVLRRPGTPSSPFGGSIIVTAQPVAALAEELSAFDGDIDFGGTSGQTRTITGGFSATAHLSDPADLLMFSGPGALDLPVLATGMASAGGGAGLLAVIVTAASATANVSYTYVPVPAPAALTLGAVGLMGVALRRKRRAQAPGHRLRAG